MPILGYVVVAVAAYLLGSIPTGFLVARARGIDIRAVGSGNIGATNAMRVLGKPAGIFVLLADGVKGWLACFLGKAICVFFLSFTLLSLPAGEPLENFPPIKQFEIIAGIFAVLGHNYTCWLGFKGGKGIATSAGVYLALAPHALGIAFAVFILAAVSTRYVSLGSILAAVALPVMVWAMTPDNLLLGIVTTALGAMVIYKHTGNIQRLIAGTENRLQFKKKEVT